MSTEACLADVAQLATRLSELPFEAEPARPTTVGVYMLALHVESTDLRAISAINNAFQLAFDAASVAEAMRFNSGLGQPSVALDLVWGGAGSWREVFILSPRGSLARERLNYIVGLALQCLQMIPGVPSALGLGLNAVFVGSMLYASAYSAEVDQVPVESVDADALKGVKVIGDLYPPGKVWRVPSSADADCLANLAEYIQHNHGAHFTVAELPDGKFATTLVVDDGIREHGKAEALARWHAQENDVPYL